MDNNCSILQKIVKRKREEVSILKGTEFARECRKRAIDNPSSRDFYRAISKKRKVGLNLIAEIKLASPLGDIRPEAIPRDIAEIYESCNINAISILTDLDFKGSIFHLLGVSNIVSTPLLRKDFIIDQIQIYESRIYGADAILLISAILEKSQIRDYIGLARKLKMYCLVESHNESELEKAIDSKAEIFGINNRNLATFETDINNTKRLAKLVPEGYPIVTESGINSYLDVLELSIPKVKAMLVGEALMSQEKNPTNQDIRNKIYELQGKDYIKY